jgi:hypothetical protein
MKKPWLVKYKLWIVAAVITVAAMVFVVIRASSSNAAKSQSSKADSSAASSVGQGESQPTIAGTLDPTGTTQDTSQVAATPPAPKVYEGTGDDVVTIQKPYESASAIVKFECPTCTHYLSVRSNGADSLLVSDIGAYSGSHLIDTAKGSVTSELTITANAAWKVTVGYLDMATQQIAGQPVGGTGDTVVHLLGSTYKAAITNFGESNFTIKTFPEDGGNANLAVNTIGSYKGTVPLVAPSYVQVGSKGNWTITPQ